MWPIFLLHSPVRIGRWVCCRGVWGSVWPIFSTLTCSYRSISLLSGSLRVCVTYFYYTHLFVEVDELVVGEFEGLCDLFLLHSPVRRGRWACCRGVWGSVCPIFTSLTCSYRSISLLSGSLRVCMACRTVSQCPLLMSLMKPSTESTVFSEIPVSSCRMDRVRRRLFSFRYCSISLTTLKANQWEKYTLTPWLIFECISIESKDN